jgi:hypothetical protein
MKIEMSFEEDTSISIERNKICDHKERHLKFRRREKGLTTSGFVGDLFTSVMRICGFNNLIVWIGICGCID